MALLKLLAMLALAAILVACESEGERQQSAPNVVRIGVLPDQSAEELIEKYTPLMDYLAEQTSLDIDLIVPEDYASLLDDFSAYRMDIANFGGFTYIQAEHRNGAEPLVMRDVDLDFASCYLVRDADTRQSIDEFQGETFAFGPKLSTSGHLMPRYFLRSAGIDPDAFFATVRYSSGHDETAAWIRYGEVAIGVANCIIVESMMRDGRLGPGEVRVLETTPAYADYVWAVQEKLRPALKTKLRNAFLALDATLPEHQSILQKLGANAYLPASRADFDDVRRAARTIDLPQVPDLK